MRFHRIFAISTVLYFMLTALYSQSSGIICGNSVFKDIVTKQYPALDASFDQTFRAAQTNIERGGEELTINVVVHVVWKEEEENLADEIIYDQLRILNEDFNKLNADGAKLRPLFKPVAGNAAIRFELVDIVRVQTDTEFEIDLLGNNLLPEVKHTDQGGSDAWDNDLFLNIWVCKIQPLIIFGQEFGQILGFAFPPNNLPNWPADSGAPNADEDGVVIDYRVFGSNNPNGINIPGGGGALVVKGRTPVHEVGHYLGLRHIWGDGGLLGPNDCDQSDGIGDTPYANAQSAFDCDTTRNTCLIQESHYGEDVPDLIENFMDYASEDCMNMFTQGQVDLMRSVLQGPRSGLLTPFSSVTPLDSEKTFSIAPNPTSGECTLTFQHATPGTMDVFVNDLHGKTVYRRSGGYFSGGKQQIQLELESIPAGMYFISLVRTGQVVTQKCMIQ